MSSGGPAKLPSPASAQDLLGLPDEGRGYELIDGELVEKAAGFRHGRAQFTMASFLAPYKRRSGGGDRPGGWWFLTGQLVDLAPGCIVRPDVAGWLRERLAEPPKDDEATLRIRPDWVCEITSPKKAGEDLIRKRRLYHAHEVPFYWIVDPRDELLFAVRSASLVVGCSRDLLPWIPCASSCLFVLVTAHQTRARRAWHVPRQGVADMQRVVPTNVSKEKPSAKSR